MSFPCTKCGACCRSIGGFAEMAEHDRGDGTCKHLTDANECGIYEERPLLCRVDELKPQVVTDAYWYSANLEACSRLHLQVYGRLLR